MQLQFCAFFELVLITEINETLFGAVFRAEHVLYNIYLKQHSFGQCSIEQRCFEQYLRLKFL